METTAVDDYSHDAHLAARVRAGDSGAFEALFLTYYAALCTFAEGYTRSRDTAEDIVADVFGWVWTHHETWTPTTSIRAFLYGAVRNRCLNAARDRATAARSMESADPALIAPVPLATPDAQLDQAQADAMVWNAVATLSERQRTIMSLRWRGELSWKEIGAVLGISPNAAETEHRRAINRLRIVLPKLFGD